jgi:MEMO1 family protein
MSMPRKAAVAGTWYPGTPDALAAAVDRHLVTADASATELDGDLVGLIAPHAGLRFSGPVAAHAYRLLRTRAFDVAVLVGPSHYVGFEGVSVVPSGGFETPFGVVPIDADCARAISRASPIIHDHPAAHTREHSLEMQLPFLARLAPGMAIVPLLMGVQTAATATALGVALAATVRGRNALLIASTDLSHFHDVDAAFALDRVVIDCVSRLDADALQAALEREPHHACGGGPMVAVMRAAQAAGAHDAVVLNYADSGDVTGDKSSVVGYMAAALGTFTSRAGARL